MPSATYPERDYRFGLSILALRTASNLTQSALAERLGVSRQTIAGWEAGTNYPSPKHLLHLIELCLQYQVFHPGQEAEEIRALWENTYPRVPLDETWLAHRLEQPAEAPGPAVQPTHAELLVDWGDAPDVANFCGREIELTLLTDWLLKQRCRVLSILGMGGIGKTSLAARLVLAVMSSPEHASSEHVRFERIYWRSLRDAPPPAEWLAGAIRFLSDQEMVPPSADSERLNTLLQLLRARRCLLVLDNFETLFEPNQAEGHYRPGLAGYGRLLRALGETSHQSCLVVTSRETLPELAMLSGETVRAIPLRGLGVDETQRILATKELVGNSQQWAELTRRFGGNGLALKMVGERIRELFGGDIGLYLEHVGASSLFGSIRQLLAEQVDRSAVIEQQVLRALAAARDPVRLTGLLDILGSLVGQEAVLEAVEALNRRSLVERVEAGGSAAFTLQSVVLEYMTNRLVEEVTGEITGSSHVLLVEQPLILALTRDYVRQSQERLIGMPILAHLKTHWGQEEVEQRLLALLEGWRGRPVEEQGYGPGNIVNLLRLQRGNLRGLDLSRLVIRQAYLAEVDAQDASLIEAHLAEGVLAEAFSFPYSVALSRDGSLLAAGTSAGQVWLWRVADRTLLASIESHTGQVSSVAFSASGQQLASGGSNGMVQLWDMGTGRLLARLEGHTAGVMVIAFSTDSQLLASGSLDGTVRVWETNTGKPLATLQGHTGGVWGVAISANGRMLVSGGADGTVRLWEVSSGQLRATLEGHTSAVWAVALSVDGRLLVSGSLDGTLRLWDAPNGQLLSTLQAHTAGVWNLALSDDGKTMASSGGDGILRLWDIPSRRLLSTLQGHSGGVRGLALSADGNLLVSGSVEGKVRLWDAPKRQLLATLQGHTGGIWRVALSESGDLVASSGGDGILRLWDVSSEQQILAIHKNNAEIRVVALSAGGRLLASGGLDGTVRLWEVPSGRSLATLEGHTSPVWGLALSADGQVAASGGVEGTARLWETSSGRLLTTLQGHNGAVRSVALSADGRLVASASTDGTVRLWEVPGGRLLAVLERHTSAVWGVALSADGRLLASADLDGIVQLWDAPAGRPLATLTGKASPIWGLAVSPDGRMIASGGMDEAIQLWEAPGGRLLSNLLGHTGPVPAVSFSANGRFLASGGWDGTVRLWDMPNGTHVRTLRTQRRYERLDITSLKGITGAQRSALMALGAVENETNPGVDPITQ